MKRFYAVMYANAGMLMSIEKKQNFKEVIYAYFNRAFYELVNAV